MAAHDRHRATLIRLARRRAVSLVDRGDRQRLANIGSKVKSLAHTSRAVRRAVFLDVAERVVIGRWIIVDVEDRHQNVGRAGPPRAIGNGVGEAVAAEVVRIRLVLDLRVAGHDGGNSVEPVG